MTLKIKLWFNAKRKKKRNWCARDKKLFYLFLNHRHAVLSRGTQQNSQKILECSNLFLITLFSIVSTWSDNCIGFQNHGSQDRSDMSGPHRVPEPWQLSKSNISDTPDLSGLHQVPVPCHPSLIRYIREASDISDPAEFEPVWISHRTYLI
jgi:hypothetical protein